MSKEEEFIEIYEYIQGRLISFPGYECPKRRDSLKKTKTFLDLHHSITADIFDFISFIFALRTSDSNRYTVIPFNQFTSKNAYKLYSERTQQQCYFTRKYQLERELRNPFEDNEKLSSVYLDSQRSKYFNSPRGYLQCSSFEGRLFDSEKCKECRYSYLCKEKVV